MATTAMFVQLIPIVLPTLDPCLLPCIQKILKKIIRFELSTIRKPFQDSFFLIFFYEFQDSS